ncbi:pentapeptide repeat-containing protein [Trebonia kvetii]|uniref:pentapeptide repeat-containing protein n=1 Tax=Trebonia kvetii TaxID=2480626 RepID=UPI003F6DDECD
MTLDHVVFADCKLDYAALSHVRTVGPVLFVRCSLREAEFRGCDLTRSLFEDCDLGLADFGPGAYRGCDLRGNDLSAISGAQHLRRVVIDRAQLLQ